MFMYPFDSAKIKKILTEDPVSWWCAIFGLKMVHLPQTKIFLENIIIIFITLLAPSIVQNLKKIITADPDSWWCTIFGPKMAHLPKREFFRKFVNKHLCFHSYLSACQKSKSDIILLMKYWQLKNTEISLAESHFGV